MSARTRKLIGLTGGIGTGKTRVSELLRSLGASVECADLVVRELQQPGGALLEAIVAEFGDGYLQDDDELDRVKFGARVFSDPEARKRLNGLTGPLVQAELVARYQAHAASGVPLIVFDIPLLLEGRSAGRGSGSMPFDLVVLVYASAATQLERVMARDGLSAEEAQARIDSQMSIEKKRELADVLIDNSGAWDATEAQVRALYADWTA